MCYVCPSCGHEWFKEPSDVCSQGGGGGTGCSRVITSKAKVGDRIFHSVGEYNLLGEIEASTWPRYCCSWFLEVEIIETSFQ